MSTKSTRKREQPKVLAFARPPKSNTGGAIPKTVYAGIDWLSLTGYGVNVPERFREELQNMKELAESSGEEVFVNLGGIDWQVMPYGFGKGASHMAYVLRGNGCVLAIAKRDKSPTTGGGPICMLTAPGQFCSGKNPFNLIDDLMVAFDACGFLVHRVGISRVDFHMDVVGRDVSSVVGLINEGKVVTRARDCDLSMKGKIHGEVETIYIGSQKSGTYLCSYNKALELRNDPLKAETYKERFNLEEIPETLTRFEWRLNGDSLRENHNVMDVKELKQRLRSIFLYLCREWYRECLTVDKKHPERSPVDPAWMEATTLAEAFFRGDEPRERRPRGIPDTSRLIQQVKGCLASVSATLGLLPENAGELATIVCKELAAGADEWREKVARRASAIRAKIEQIGFSLALREEDKRIMDVETQPC